MKQVSLVIVGGGPAGLAAAAAAREQGIIDILLIERDERLGGILNQCIHNGFGLHTFKEELTGTEYAKRYVDKVRELGIEVLTETMVVDISKDKILTLTSKKHGVVLVKANAIILAMGCRERPRGALNIPGYRPAGIYSAGTAQHLVNIEGKLPGGEIVILGSGDIGLIMARRLTFEGCKVKCVVELMPYSGGLKRNIVQCLNDFNIPLLLSHTVVQIHGKDRLSGVTIAKVDESKKPILSTSEYIACDTLLLSVGLIPENELSKGMGIAINPKTNGPMVDDRLETNIPGVFACGNVLHVHDLVDYVSSEANLAGKHAAAYIQNENESCEERITIEAKNGVSYTVPTTCHKDNVLIRFRVNQVFQNSIVIVRYQDMVLKSIKKKILTPGEMEQISLTKQELLNLSSDVSLILEVKEGLE